MHDEEHSSTGKHDNDIESRQPAATGREHQQAITRLCVGSTLLLAVLLLAFWRLPDSDITATAVVTAVGMALFLVPLGLLLAIRRRPEAYPKRLFGALLFDTVALTGVIYLGGAVTSPLCIGYGWIIFDYTRRYGRALLYPSAVASFLSFAALLLFSDFWHANTSLGLSFLAMILLLPVYLKNSGSDGRAQPTGTPATTNIAQPEKMENNAMETKVNSSRDEANSLSNRRVLLVSNDSEDRHGIQRQLSSWDTRNNRSSNAARAFYDLIAAAKVGDPYQVLIVDQGRLGMDAAQFASAVRAETMLQSLYLIHVGSDHQSQQRDRLLNAGFTKLISTPLNKTFLFNALHNTYTQPEASSQVVRLIDRYNGDRSSQPLSILLADSSLSTRQRVSSILQRAGHRVFMVDNGARVLDALDSHRFDLAIVSLELSEISGLEAFKLYRFTRVDKPWVPFILLVERLNPELLKRCTDAGINTTVLESADSRSYLEAVARVIRECSDDAESGVSTRSFAAARSGGSSTDAGVLDINRLMEIERLGGGVRFLSDLIDSFNRDNRHILTQMKSVARNAEAKQFRDLGHALKDAAGSLGTLKLYRLGTVASRLSDKDFHECANTLIQEITECCRITNNALHAYLLGQLPSETDSLRD